MKIIKLTFAVLAGIACGSTASVSAQPAAKTASLPNCFDTNYDAERRLFTIKNAVSKPANQQCLLTIGPATGDARAARLAAGGYTAYLANGGGGGGGGTLQTPNRAAGTGGGGGGGGGGGAGSAETTARLNLSDGVYKLTIGAGGPGGSACQRPRQAQGQGFGGGPGWLGSPSNIVRVATGEVLMGTFGADAYVRPTRAANERMGQKADKLAGVLPGHGGSGPGQISGGDGGHGVNVFEAKAEPAEAGDNAAGRSSNPGVNRPGTGGQAGATPADTPRLNVGATGGGGGGGATSAGAGGKGGGEKLAGNETAPVRGSLGSGGGGGVGSTTECAAGAPGGHGYIAFRRN